MDMQGLYAGCRTYRRFKQEPIPREILEKIVNTARERSSAMNGQILRYLVADSLETVKKIQPCLSWAAKLPKEIGTPTENEQPVAFVILLKPENAHPFADIDMGIVLDTMAVTAWYYGIGSCMLGAINKEKLAEAIEIPAGYEVKMILALGYPDHRSTIVPVKEEGNLSYYVDENRDYYVPKLSAEKVITYV